MPDSPKKTELFEQLGGHIRAQRESLGLSQLQAANLAVISVNLVRQIEAGKPTAHIAKVLDLMTAVGLQFELAPGNSRIEFGV